MIRKIIIYRNMVELRGWNIQFSECSALIISDFCTTIITEYEVLRIFRIDPNIMRIAVTDLNLSKSFAAIVGVLKPDVEDIQGIVITWICFNFAIIPRALPKVFIIVNACPCFTCIFAAEQATVFIFNNSPYSIAIERRNSNAHFTQYPYW